MHSRRDYSSPCAGTVPVQGVFHAGVVLPLVAGWCRQQETRIDARDTLGLPYHPVSTHAAF